MGKYFLIFKNSIQRELIYRFNTFATLIFQVLSFGMFFYLWSSIYRGGGQVGAYNMKEIVTYYLMTIFLGMAIRSSDVAWRIGDEIRLGTITNYLLKPINYFWVKMWAFLGNVTYKSIIYLGSVFIIFIFFKNYLIFSFDFERIIYFFTFVFLGILIHIIFFYIVGVSGFWFGFIMGFNFSMHMVVNFLSGSIVPLDLLPSSVLKLNDFLPFKYIIFVPVSIFNGRTDLNLSLFINPLIWIFILYIIAVFMFKRGIKKYEGYGA